jgi:hypothetical protein
MSDDEPDDDDRQVSEPRTPIPGSSGGPADEEWLGDGKLDAADDDES